jgi:predicted nuclease with TOPRIM domain
VPIVKRFGAPPSGELPDAPKSQSGRRTRNAELARLRAENAEMRSRIDRLVEEKAVLRDRLEEMTSYKHTPLRLPGTW